MKVLIFLPTYNERKNIGKMIDALNNLSFNKEILIVDDNSADGTIEIIDEKTQQYKNIVLIKRLGKKGRGLAGLTALKYFVESDKDILVELDADCSHKPKYIPDLLKYFPKFDVVIGSRLVETGGETGRTIMRSFITFFANIIIRIIFRTKVRDCTSGFRAFKKELIQHFDLNNFFSVHYAITPEILYACVLNKAKIKEVPIIFYERAGGESKFNFKKILFTFLSIFKIKLRGKKIITL
ncbi:MAG: polyprenol monophosphomannose synthase [Candidatus Hodarchaeales archaeon]|jgi:dolichol-phosphate mannosyltransferase